MLQAENGVQIQNIYDEGTVLHRFLVLLLILATHITMTRGSVEDTTAYATTNSTGYAESVLGAGIGSNGKVPSLTFVAIVTQMTIKGGDGEFVQSPRWR